MTHQFKIGDRVTWNTPQGMTTGTVVRKIVSDTELEGQHVVASNDDRHYEVESEKSGRHAVHRADAPEKVHSTDLRRLTKRRKAGEQYLCRTGNNKTLLNDDLLPRHAE